MQVAQPVMEVAETIILLQQTVLALSERPRPQRDVGPSPVKAQTHQKNRTDAPTARRPSAIETTLNIT